MTLYAIPNDPEHDVLWSLDEDGSLVEWRRELRKGAYGYRRYENGVRALYWRGWPGLLDEGPFSDDPEELEL